jgi:hypothetical protein
MTSVLCRRDPRQAPEDFPEIVGITEADPVGDLRDVEGRREQQKSRVVDAPFVEIAGE